MESQHRAYTSRYYILTVVSLLAAMQNLGWVTFSPIAGEAKEWYGLTDDEITLLPTYSPICFIILTLPFIWFLQKFGLKIVGLSSAWLLAIGCVIRCFVPYVPDASKWIWLMHIGHVLIGYVGIPIMNLPPKISSVWFKPKERTFATAIAITAQPLGLAAGFILDPLITQLYGIRTMLIVHAELSVFVALLFTIYFPSGPPTPPSVSAEEDRTSFLTSLKKMITNYPFVLLVTSCGVIVGLNGGFQSVLSIILNPSLGFNDRVIVHSVDEFFYSTSWMGLVLYLVSTFTGQITGLFADRFQRNFKLILMILIGLATVFFIWFSLSIYGWGSSNPINLFVSFCLCSIFISTSMPIYYEAAVECTYPIAEGTSASVVSLFINIGTLLFSIIGLAGVFSDQYPERAKIMSWATAFGGILALGLLFLYPEHYERLTVDVNVGHGPISEEDYKEKETIDPEIDDDSQSLLLNPDQPINAKIIRP